jgi:hypothetical protein
VAYAIGLLAINQYLLQFGVSDFGVLRPRYIGTGLLVIGVVTLAVLAALVAVAAARSLWKGPLLGRLFGILMGSGLALFYIYLFQELFDITYEDAFLVTLPCIFGALGIYSLVRAARLSEALYGRLFAEQRVFAMATIMSLASILTLASGYIALLAVSRLILPTVPEQFGGTRPHLVQLV